jgi:hypothetical protein
LKDTGALNPQKRKFFQDRHRVAVGAAGEPVKAPPKHKNPVLL